MSTSSSIQGPVSSNADNQLRRRLSTGSSISVHTYHSDEYDAPVQDETQPRQHFTGEKILSCFWFMLVTTIGIVLIIGKMSAKQIIGVGIQDYMFEYFMIAAMCFAVVLMMVVICAAPTGCLCTNNNDEHARLPLHLRRVAFIFGLVTAFSSATSFVAFLIDTREDNPRGHCFIQCNRVNPASHTIYLLVYFFFVFLQLFFLYRFSTKRFFAKFVNYLMLTHIIATNVILWLKVFVDEASKDDREIKNCLRRCCNGNYRQECNGSNLTSTIEVFAMTVRPFLDPFVLEYALICSGLMLHMWGIVVPCEEQKGENKALKSNETLSRSRIVKIKGGEGSILVGGAMFVIILMIIVFLATDILPKSTLLATVINFAIYYGARIAFYILMMALSIVGIISLNKSVFHVDDRQAEEKTRSHHVLLDVYLLFVSLMGTFLLSGFCFAATPEAFRVANGSAAGNHTALDATQRSLQAVYISDSVLNVVQCVIQTLFILICLPSSFPQISEESLKSMKLTSVDLKKQLCSYVCKLCSCHCSNCRKTSDVLSTDEERQIIQHDRNITIQIVEKAKQIRQMAWFVRHGAGVLAMCNIGFWAMLEYEINRNVSASDFIPDQYYEKNHWLIISYIIYPLAIFYRIHSAACLIGIWMAFCHEPAELKAIACANDKNGTKKKSSDQGCFPLVVCSCMKQIPVTDTVDKIPEADLTHAQTVSSGAENPEPSRLVLGCCPIDVCSCVSSEDIVQRPGEDDETHPKVRIHEPAPQYEDAATQFSEAGSAMHESSDDRESSDDESENGDEHEPGKRAMCVCM